MRVEKVPPGGGSEALHEAAIASLAQVDHALQHALQPDTLGGR
jgi:hypothetical protein